MTTPTPAATLSELLFGYRISQAISVATSLGVADALAAGARGADDLATALGCHPVSLYRLLRLLAAAGVLEEDGDRRFALTPVGELLRADAPGSMREYADVKREAERAVDELARQHPSIRFSTPRLPRLATDQTTSVMPTEVADTIPVLLDLIRSAT